MMDAALYAPKQVLLSNGNAWITFSRYSGEQVSWSQSRSILQLLIMVSELIVTGLDVDAVKAALVNQPFHQGSLEGNRLAVPVG